VRAFVSHCGINSAYEALAAGVPVVGIPLIADQQQMALRIRDAGVGVMLDKTRLSAKGLRAAIRRVLNEEAIRARLPTIEERVRQAGGTRRAADLVEGLLRA
jgi:MGT family glycosyltransferase